ncbi:MAG: DNA alkylation repair protein [Myxococcales bacterium]|nr:DNA alkylation repair protein [Myxococcales bacterium]
MPSHSTVPDITSHVSRFREALEAVATPERAVNEKAYLKSDLTFLGARVPEIRGLATAYRREHPKLDPVFLLDLTAELWASEVHELRSLAIALLAKYARSLPQEAFAHTYSLLCAADTWAHVDWMCTEVFAVLLARFPSTLENLDGWSEHENFWVRRGSMLVLLPSLKKEAVHWQRFCSYAATMLEEREFFIRKAIGWILRETSKRDPAGVTAFLEQHIDKLSGLTFREGSRKLAPAEIERLKGLRSK